MQCWKLGFLWNYEIWSVEHRQKVFLHCGFIAANWCIFECIFAWRKNSMIYKRLCNFCRNLVDMKNDYKSNQETIFYALQCILITIVVECKNIIKLVINLNNDCDFKTMKNLWNCFWLDRWVWSTFYDDIWIAVISISLIQENKN